LGFIFGIRSLNYYFNCFIGVIKLFDFDSFFYAKIILDFLLTNDF